MNARTLDPKRLTLCREKLGITKQEAAKRMHLSQPAYLRYEAGERIPSMPVIMVMADVLATSPAYLTKETDDPSPNCFYVRAENEPELFQLIKSYRTTDVRTKERLLAYVSKFIEL
ncbi:MAG: helix-turn-helix transcriptional regulator [Lachnospiraceae bacterium]|nr:helix-turn-helix transcriptional regulator [Lachnospiraceae bacterium]